MDVFRQRLEDEYDASVIITAPTVPYQGECSALRMHTILIGCQWCTGRKRAKK